MKKNQRLFYGLVFLVVCLVMGAFSMPVFGTASDDSASFEERVVQVEQQWGVKPLNIRLTGSDYFLDFRFLVTDSEKAKPVLARGNKAYLMDQQSGKVFNVPVTKIGPLRGTTVQPQEGKQYVILFGNTNKLIHRGSTVSIIIEDFKVENMVVE